MALAFYNKCNILYADMTIQWGPQYSAHLLSTQVKKPTCGPVGHQNADHINVGLLCHHPALLITPPLSLY